MKKAWNVVWLISLGFSLHTVLSWQGDSLRVRINAGMIKDAKACSAACSAAQLELQRFEPGFWLDTCVCVKP